MQRSGSTWILAEDNELNTSDWHSTEIILDFDKMEELNYQSGDIINIYIHELGHALKLSHSFYEYRYNVPGKADTWKEISPTINIMNASASPTPAGESVISILPKALDGWRLAHKWNSVS